MSRKILVAAVIAFSSMAHAGAMNTWYAGTNYTGTVKVQGLTWRCSGGSCVLRGPYGNGLNMDVCQELAYRVGGLSYYYNDSGMIWSATQNRALLDQCNGW